MKMGYQRRKRRTKPKLTGLSWIEVVVLISAILLAIAWIALQTFLPHINVGSHHSH